MGTLLHDLRYSFRTLWKSPGFAVVAIVTLTLGIGANTAVFSVVNGVPLRPLPYRDSDRLLAMRGNLSRLDMDDFKERSQTLDEGGAVTNYATLDCLWASI
jgi:putative ABC transport system permease protein